MHIGKVFFRASLAAVLITQAVLPANASPVIYDNGASVNGGMQIELSLFVDDFVLAPDQAITGIRWTGFVLPGPPAADKFNIRIFTDAGGSPSTAGPIVTLGATATPVDTGKKTQGASGIEIFSYDIAISPLVLAAGTYWLSIQDDATISDPSIDWFWGMQSNSGNGFVSSFGSTDRWFPIGHRFDFQLHGVPEPASLALLGLGLVGLRLSRRTPMAGSDRAN